MEFKSLTVFKKSFSLFVIVKEWIFLARGKNRVNSLTHGGQDYNNSLQPGLVEKNEYDKSMANTHTLT